MSGPIASDALPLPKPPTPTESEILRDILLAIGSRADCRLWRNNVGAAQGKRGLIRFGLEGSADASGILVVNGLGVRLEIEAKTATGRQRPAQRKFQAMIDKFGGCYILARSAADAVNGIERFLRDHPPAASSECGR